MIGHNIDDLHRLQKDKLQALVFSAVKELDKIQQNHIQEIYQIKNEEIKQIKSENSQLKQRIERLEKYLSLS